MNITWTTKAYGWEGILARNAKVMNDPTKPKNLRHAADMATQKIERQLKDKALMSLREQLMKATRANDERSIINITKQIRSHTGDDLETGLPE